MATVTLLHPGSMGAPLAAHAVMAGHKVLWLPADRSEASARRAEQAGLLPQGSLHSALEQSDVVLSVCPPHAAEDVAASVAAHGYMGIYVDANAISPQRLTRISARMPAGCTVLDGAIIGPPPAGDRTARLYLAGPPDAARLLTKVFDGTSVHVKEAGSNLGSASALKMAFASYQKAARTLAGVAYAYADVHGVSDLLTAEAEIMPAGILADPGYLPSVAARAWRWGPEMEEAADTLRAAHLPADLATAAAAVLARWSNAKDEKLPLPTVLNQLRVASDAEE